MPITANLNSAAAAPASSFMPHRNVSIDVLKIVLACMVIGIHTGVFHDISPALGYFTGEGIFRVAVPIFLIINGFYFFPVLQRNGVRGWFVRVVGLYLFWMAVYAYFWIPTLDLTAPGMIKGIRILVVGYYHLWYVAGMIGAGLIVLACRNVPRKFVMIAALALYLVGVAIQYFGNYHVFGDPRLDRIFNITWVHRNFLFLSFPFFYIGYFINETNLHARVKAFQLRAVFMLGLVLLLVESFLNFNNPISDGAFDNYMALVLICPVVFIAVLNTKIYRAGGELSLYSSAIFFVHILVLYVLRGYLDVGPTAMAVVVLAASVVVANVLVRLSKKFRFIL